jgi:hypothetical protein
MDKNVLEKEQTAQPIQHVQVFMFPSSSDG